MKIIRTLIILLRKLPVVCLVIALLKMLVGRFKFSRLYKGNVIQMEDGIVFKIFRDITLIRNKTILDPITVNDSCVFIVRFKFSKLSHRANKIVSVIPMLIIAGSPGFEQKIYAVNPDNGYWQGMYQWQSLAHLEDYKRSFIYRMMNRRAVPESIKTMQWKNQTLDNFIRHHTDKQFNPNKSQK